MGGLCCYCHIPAGVTIRCCHPGCTCSYHATCHYYNGGFMDVVTTQKEYVGGGQHPEVTSFCFAHDVVRAAEGCEA